MAVEPTFASVSFPLIAVELPIGEFAAAVQKYMHERAQRKEEPKKAMIEDLRAVKAIVMRLTDSYVQSMLNFMNDDTVSDPTRLKAAIDEANEYLKKRQVLPNLIELTNEIKGQVKQFSPSVLQYLFSSSPSVLQYLDAVWASLESFQSSVGGQGMITAVGLEQLKTTVQEAEELLKLLKSEKPPTIGAVTQFKAATCNRYESTNIRPSDEVYACVGRAIGELKGVG